MLRTASAIHSASCTIRFSPRHGFDMLGVGYHHFKEAFQTSIHLHPLHSRALHAHVATLLLHQPGTQGQQIRCFIAERADLFASLSRLNTTQTHHQKAQMHVNACAPLLHYLSTHVYRSFLFSALLPCVRQHPRRCLPFYSVFFVLSCVALAGEATWSGSSRHLSIVSKTRWDTVQCWSSSLQEVTTLSIEPGFKILFHREWCACGA